MSRRGRHVFTSRKCWLCGHEMKTRDEIDFFIPGDYNGVCKDHHLKDILRIKGENIRTIKLRNNIIIKSKNRSKMRKFLITLFIFIVGFEIIIHLPHIINVLISKIK
jgi:hypothetical protein